jgi:hypothetical protein
MATGFNVAGLQPYTDELSQDLLIRSVLKPASVSKLTVKAGITANSYAFNILGSTISAKPYACGFASGQTDGNTTIFTQQVMPVETLMVKEVQCIETLREYWISSAMSASAYANETPVFEKAITDLKVAQINAYIETTIWQGNLGTGGSIEGLQSILSVTNGAVSGVSAAADFASASTAYAGFWKLVDALSAANPAVMQNDDLIMYVSLATYSKLVQSLLNKGVSLLQPYANINNVGGSPVNEFTWPGTQIRVFGTPGISDDLVSPSVPSVYLYPQKYVYYGVGVDNDQSRFKYYYNPADDNLQFLAAWRMGVSGLADQGISTTA